MSTSGPAHRVVSAVEQYGFPNGHIGHLTPEEEETLKIFKHYCEEKGFYKPGDGADEYGTHDDATLLSVLLHLICHSFLRTLQTFPTSTTIQC